MKTKDKSVGAENFHDLPDEAVGKVSDVPENYLEQKIKEYVKTDLNETVKAFSLVTGVDVEMTESDHLRIEYTKELKAITDKLETVEQKMNELFNMLKLIGGREIEVKKQ